MADKDKPPPSAKTRRTEEEAAQRQRRLEQALRDNLAKRKRQARLRAGRGGPAGKGD